MTQPKQIIKKFHEQGSDISFSMLVDHHSPPSTTNIFSTSPEDNNDTLSRIQARQRSSWVDDRVAKTCFLCKMYFNFYHRPHHCRKCGNVFCYQCSNNWMEIPDHIGQLPIEPKSFKGSLSKMIWSENKVRVCDSCSQEIKDLRNMDTLFKLFDLLPLTVIDYRLIRQVSKKWNKLGNYYLSKFRELQYKLPYQEFTQSEKRLLIHNRELLAGHSLLTMAYIRACGTTDVAFHQKKASCKSLMCSRICTKNIAPYEAIMLLKTARNNKSLLLSILGLISSGTTTRELTAYIPLLIEELMLCPEHTRDEISKFLNDQAKEDLLIAGHIYWGLKIKLSSDKITIKDRNTAQKYQKRLINELDEKGLEYIDNIEALILFLNNLSKKSNIDQVKKIFHENACIFMNLRLPLAPHLICKRVIVDKIKIKASSSRPIFMPLECYNEKTGKMCNYYLLYKFEDVRQDYIVLNTINVIKSVLKSELRSYSKRKDTMQLITYNVFPTSDCSGLIEIIPDCRTLYEVQQKFTIFNYILEKNRDSGYSADILRKRFLESCAAYCVMTYLLGVGDRHLENIMITKSGYLFHIDYGFIIGAEPKPVHYPTMRITTDMVDAMGGTESNYYREFVELSKEIHHCLQKRLPTFYVFLELLITATPEIKANRLTRKKLVDELICRFMYGENYEQSGMQLSVHISSSSNSYNHTIMDFFHRYGKESTVAGVVNGTMSWVSSLFSS